MRGRAASLFVVSMVAFGAVFAVGGGVAIARSGKRLTKDEYIDEYNSLCDTSITNFQAALDALGPNHNLEQSVAALAPIYEHRLKETRKLVPPNADRKRVKALIAAQQSAIDKVKDKADVLAGSRRVSLFSFPEGDKAEKLATRYGLESGNCLDTEELSTAGQPAACPGGPCAGPPGQPLPPGVTAPRPGGTVPPPSPTPAGAGRPGSTPAAQWVTAVCAAETTLHGTLQGELDAIKGKRDAASQKQGFVDFISGLPAQIKPLERAIKKAGAPNVANGKKIAKTYLKTLKTIVKKVPSVKSMAEALPTSSPDAFQSAAKSIGNAIDAIKGKGDEKVSSLDVSGTLAPDLGRCGGTFPL